MDQRPERGVPRALARQSVVGLIRAYQYLVSPVLGPRCRYWPSCSQFGVEAVAQWGVGRGLALTLGRFLRCHPWSAGGVDPVPTPDTQQASSYLGCVLRRPHAPPCSSDLP